MPQSLHMEQMVSLSVKRGFGRKTLREKALSDLEEALKHPGKCLRNVWKISTLLLKLLCE